MSDFARRVELSVYPQLADPWDVTDLLGANGLAAYAVALERGMPWREAAARALSVDAG